MNISDTVIALEVREGAHHLDMMWAEVDDPQSVRGVRKAEKGCIKRWIEESATPIPTSRDAAAVSV